MIKIFESKDPLEYSNSLRMWRLKRCLTITSIITQTALIIVDNYNYKYEKKGKKFLNQLTEDIIIGGRLILQLLNDVMIYIILLSSLSYYFSKYA
jgi:hypothetical protein